MKSLVQFPNGLWFSIQCCYQFLINCIIVRSTLHNILSIQVNGPYAFINIVNLHLLFYKCKVIHIYNEFCLVCLPFIEWKLLKFPNMSVSPFGFSSYFCIIYLKKFLLNIVIYMTVTSSWWITYFVFRNCLSLLLVNSYLESKQELFYVFFCWFWSLLIIFLS